MGSKRKEYLTPEQARYIITGVFDRKDKSSVACIT